MKIIDIEVSKFQAKGIGDTSKSINDYMYRYRVRYVIINRWC